MAELTIDLNTMNAAYDAPMFSTSRHLVCMGGAGSGKSYFAADKCILQALTNPESRIGVFRKVARTIKRSVWALILERLQFFGLAGAFDTNRTDFTIRLSNGSEIWCVGLDDQEKLKSIQGLSFAWVEEATECYPEDITQINLRMRGKTPGYKQIIYTFNPISRRHHLKKTFFDERPDDCEIIVTTYRDNKYIDDEYKSEIEKLRRQSENLYRVYGMGEWGTLEGLVYKRGFAFPEQWPDYYDDMFYGLDFGYNHPIALVEVGIVDGEPFVTERIYASGMTTSDLISEMDGMDISKEHIIYADAAEPDRIEEIKRAGYMVEPAYKGAGSVRSGIDFLQSLNINSRPENVNLNAEMESYSWRMSATGEPMDEPVKLNDDAMDAMRYAIYTHIGKPRAELFTYDRAGLGI